MRLGGLKSLRLWAVAVLMTGAVAGCSNPFDPLSTSDKIQGLSYFDFAASQDRWDSDPESDGISITMTYYNEFGTSLSFTDKPHSIQIEFWSQDEETKAQASLLTTKTVTFTNSDDLIRIPIESYSSILDLPSLTDITGCLLLRVSPPQAYPQAELVSITCGVVFYTYEVLPL